jgi:hypothetical protein
VLGKTGSTWRGDARRQHGDPHLHLGFERRGTLVSPFPTIVEAYFRDYGDPILPMAGRHGFALPVEPYTLDGTRSLARPGRSIASMRWRLHDGREVDQPRTTVHYQKPGLYAEELIVRADDGSEDRDFFHVRVFDPERGRDIARGLAYYSPARDIHPGTEVMLWNRLRNIRDARVDFGDGSPPEPISDQATHVYQQPGLYTVAVTATGPDDEPVAQKLRLRVNG